MRHTKWPLEYIHKTHTRIFGYDGTARVVGKSCSMQLASSVSECQRMHFWHLFATNSLSSWHGHHPNMSAYTPISEVYIDSSNSITNHDTNYSTHKKT